MQIHCFYLLLSFFIAIFIFIGHGSNPRSTFQMPPSSDGDTGRLIFLSREPKQSQIHGHHMGQTGQFSSSEYNARYDDLSDFQLAAGKTLFICQACYSGNTVSGMTKS